MRGTTYAGCTRTRSSVEQRPVERRCSTFATFSDPFVVAVALQFSRPPRLYPASPHLTPHAPFLLFLPSSDLCLCTSRGFSSVVPLPPPRSLFLCPTSPLDRRVLFGPSRRWNRAPPSCRA